MGLRADAGGIEAVERDRSRQFDDAAHGRKLDYLIVGLLTVAISITVLDRIMPRPVREGQRAPPATATIDANPTIRAETHLWLETYDRPLDDIFAVQDEIAASVVERLKRRLPGTTPKAQVSDTFPMACLSERRVCRPRAPVARFPGR